MSTDESGERTQRPTERRRREARARGDVARSANLVTGLVLLAATAGLWWLGPSLVTELAGLVRTWLSTAPLESVNEQIVAASLIKIAQRVGFAVLPIFLVIISAAAVSNLVQTGFLWVPAAALPRMDRIDPARQFHRWWKFSSWLGFAASILKLVVLLGVLFLFVRSRLGAAGALAEGNPAAMLEATARLMGELGIWLSLSLVVMGGIDYGWQYYRYEHSLLMTLEEVRREEREENVDPRMKRHLRNRTGSRPSGTDAGSVNGAEPV